MTRAELERVLSLILNDADFEEIEIIKQALERRARDLNRVGAVGGSLGKMARNAARQIEDQQGLTQQRIHNMVTDLIKNMIREKAPELSEDQIQELTDAWAPPPGAPRQAPPRPTLPQGAVLAMTEDFLAYAEGRLPVRKEAELRESLGSDWTKVIWSKLPERVCKLIVVLLEGKIDRKTFWDEVRASVPKET